MIDKIIVNEQSSIKIITNNKIIYFDPFNIKSENNDADIIFITHSHYDHFSIKDINKVRKDNTIFIIPKDMLSLLLEINIKENNIISLLPKEEIEINNILIKGVLAYNIDKAFHKKENNWLGYLINLDNNTIYVCGDTDNIPEMDNIKCDILFIPIGGIYTMNYKEASIITNKINPKIVIPIHYGTIVGTKKDFDKFKKLIDKNIEVIERISLQ